MDSFSSPSGGSSSKLSANDLMDQLKLQLAQAFAEEFLECRPYVGNASKSVSPNLATVSVGVRAVASLGA